MNVLVERTCNRVVHVFASCSATDSGWAQKNKNTVADWVQIKAASLTSQLEQERSE